MQVELTAQNSIAKEPWQPAVVAKAAELLRPEQSRPSQKAAPVGVAEPHAIAQSPADDILHRPSAPTLEKMSFYRPVHSAASGGATAPGTATPGSTPSTATANTAQPVAVDSTAEGQAAEPYTGCETCANRQYQDGSNDAGVSFQTPTHVPSSLSGVAVASHEGEHVTRENAKAESEGRVVVHQSVTFQMSFCPECNRMYVAGGTTSITTQDGGDQAESVSAQELVDQLGKEVDLML